MLKLIKQISAMSHPANSLVPRAIPPGRDPSALADQQRCIRTGAGLGVKDEYVSEAKSRSSCFGSVCTSAATGDQIATLHARFKSIYFSSAKPIECVCWSRDGEKILILHARGNSTVYNVPTRQFFDLRYRVHTSDQVIWSANSAQIAILRENNCRQRGESPMSRGNPKAFEFCRHTLSVFDVRFASGDSPIRGGIASRQLHDSDRQLMQRRVDSDWNTPIALNVNKGDQSIELDHVVMGRSITTKVLPM